MGTISQESLDRMVFTTEEHIKWASGATSLPDDDGTYVNPVPRPPDLPDSWVYFIHSGEGGPIKIGYSKDPYNRFVGIQTGSPVDHIYLGNIPGDRAVEHALHHQFRDHRIRGEWFSPAPEILEYVETHRLRYETIWRPDEVAELPNEAVIYRAGTATLF